MSSHNEPAKLLAEAGNAQRSRSFYSAYPENPRAYAEEANAQGLEAFQKLLNTDFAGLHENPHSQRVGEEVSPYMMLGLGIKYPAYKSEELIRYAEISKTAWQQANPGKKASVLIDSLDRISGRFFEIAYATMHTTGQSFVMSFQASGPHANDRALEVISMAHEELTRFENRVEWIKPMGKFDLKLQKNYLAIPKGIGLVVGCSTFPTWNTVPGLYANLMAGNPVIVKPHPKSILPIAIVVAEIQAAFKAAGFDANLCQLAADTIDHPITKELAEHDSVKLIDYTGGNAFGDYLEALPGKTSFTEKAGVNSILLDSVEDIDAVAGNIAFSACLYSGQMCTAPQNIFVPAAGIRTAAGTLDFDAVVEKIAAAVKILVENPKMGPFTLGAIQNDATTKRVEEAAKNNNVALDSIPVTHPEFPDARMKSPVLMVTEAANSSQWKHECFGPALFIVKTANSSESLKLAAESALEVGAITCLCYSTDKDFQKEVEQIMNATFTPVSFNFTGAAFVNQHAAFSDFHVSGGNPSGNAGFTNPEYVNKRWIWRGNRSM